MGNIRCAECGRFISYSSIEENKIIVGIDRAWDGEPLGEWYLHKSCEDKL